MEAGLNASLGSSRKTMEIRTKHSVSRAGFAAGLEGLKAMEIGAKQYDKENLSHNNMTRGPFLDLKT